MRWVGWALSQCHWCPCKKRDIWMQTQTHKESAMRTQRHTDTEVRSRAGTEAEVGVMLLRAREHLGSQEAGGGKEGSSLRGSGGSMALSIPWLWTCSLQHWERNFCGFKPPSLWYVAVAALETAYSPLGSHSLFLFLFTAHLHTG